MSILDSGERQVFETGAVRDISKGKEEWKPVLGYESLYEVSNIGRVRSKIAKTRIVDKENRIMRQKLDNHGYYRVNLSKDGRMKALLVSRIVAQAFIPNPHGYRFVGHDNDVKTNNSIENLYWTTQKENNYHNGKLEKFHAEHRAKIRDIAKKLSCPVIGKEIKTGCEVCFSSMQEAGKNGFRPEKISDCCLGKRKTHKGYEWRKAQ